MSVPEDLRQTLDTVAKGSAAERASEYYKDVLKAQWREAIGNAIGAAAKKDAGAALTAVLLMAAVKKMADTIRFDISEAHSAEELLKFQ